MVVGPAIVFSQGQTSVQAPISSSQGILLAADFDGDGAGDLMLIPSANTGGAAVLLRRNGQSFGGPMTVTFSGGAAVVNAAAAGDLTGDGLVDLVVSNGATGGQPAVQILPGAGGGGVQFGVPRTAALGGGNFAQGIELLALCTIDTGLPKLFAWSKSGQGFGFTYSGGQNGAFAQPLTLPSISVPGVPGTNFGCANAGVAHLAVLDPLGNDPTVFGGAAAGVLTAATVMQTGTGATVADFNGDGLIDLAILQGSTVLVYRNIGMPLANNNQYAGFESPRTFQVMSSGGVTFLATSASSPTAHPDLIVYSGNQIAILRNTTTP
jgi:hypothetical protein